MTIITTTIRAPEILFSFNPLLLMGFLERLKWRVEHEIIPLSIKKIRRQDIGKGREFDKLMWELDDVYGRKIAEETDYKAKNKEKIEKVPHIPTSSGTMRFKRVRS